MTPDPRGLLREAGEALYGPRWHAALAADLGVTDRTVRFWLSGRQRPQPGVWDDLARLAATRRFRLARLIAELTGDLADPLDPAA